MAKTLAVNGGDLEKYRDDLVQVLVGEYGKGHQREVRFVVRFQSFDVYDHGELVLSSQLAEDAARAFNSIKPRH